MKTPRLSVLEKIGFGAGDMAVNVVWSSMALILTFFYTDIYGLKAADIGLLMLLPRLIDAFADVAMGMITDKHMTRWGRYRPYLLLFSVPFGLSVMLVYTTPDLAYNGKLLWAYATYILMMLVFTSVTIPYISLIGVLTEDPQERLSANGYRLFFAKVAAFMVTIIVPLMRALGHWPPGPGLSNVHGPDGRDGDLAVSVLFLHHDGAGEAQGGRQTVTAPAAAPFQKRPVGGSRRRVCHRHHRLCHPGIRGGVLRQILFIRQPAGTTGRVVAIPHHPFLARQMERSEHRRRGPAFKFSDYRRGCLHPGHGRFHLGHEKFLQGPALPVEPDRNGGIQRYSLFCGQTR
jgi:hypothetical protein